MEKPPTRDDKSKDLRGSDRALEENLRIAELEEKLKDVSKWLEAEVGLKTLELFEKNQELEQAYKKLESLTRTKNEFLRIISHEIRTPLNGILGSFVLLKDMVGTQEQKEFLGMFEISLRRLENFALTAIQIAELQALNHQLPKKQFMLTAIIEEVKKIIGFDQHQRILAVDMVQGDQPVMINRALFISALTKIFDNSVKFSPPGSTVTVTLSREEEGTHFVISDKGPGFPGDVLLRKFEPFVTGETHVEGNPGMSLSMVKVIIEGHGGKIDIYNQRHNGAVVDFYIP